MLEPSDFEPRVPTAADGQKLQVLWAERLVTQTYNKAQKEAWSLWIRIGSGVVILLGAITSFWTAFHGR
jgi:nitric oxide reductase large subunit